MVESRVEYVFFLILGYRVWVDLDFVCCCLLWKG